MDNNFKMSPEFLMGMIYGARKNSAKNNTPQNNDIDTETQLIYAQKYIEKAFEHVSCFSLREFAMVMKLIDELGNACKQICKNHNWSIDND